jgi:hypothetical protein
MAKQPLPVTCCTVCGKISYNKDPDAVPQVDRAMKESMDLLAIILSDGSTKYQLSNPEHLPIAENIAMEVEREGLLRMPSENKEQ